jgi:hypothetical protein
MKKIMILGLLVLVGLLIVGCSEEMTDDELDSALGEMTDEELDAVFAEDDSTIAGQAFKGNYQSSPEKYKKIKSARKAVKKKTASHSYTCEETDDEVIIKRDGQEYRRRAKSYCYGGNVRERYCPPGRSWYSSRINERCEANEECSEAQCVSLCGNAAVDEGETCSSCPADVSCGEGQECRENECVVGNSCVETEEGLLHNGELEPVNLCHNTLPGYYVRDCQPETREIGIINYVSCSEEGENFVCQSGECVALEVD